MRPEQLVLTPLRPEPSIALRRHLQNKILEALCTLVSFPCRFVRLGVVCVVSCIPGERATSIHWREGRVRPQHLSGSFGAPKNLLPVPGNEPRFSFVLTCDQQVHNFVRIRTMFQYTNSYILRALLAHHQVVHSCIKNRPNLLSFPVCRTVASFVSI